MSQRKALETTITAGQGTLGDRHAALVELCRVLADQMDAAGDAGPSGRVVASYLSALKDLGRALGNAAPRSAGGKLASLQDQARKRRDRAAR
jgi:hypothetical protein